MVKDGGQLLELNNNKRVKRLPKGFECLPDELLAEILYWRRCNKSVIQCKCVCRRWCSVISEAEFLREWDKRNVRASYHMLYHMTPSPLSDKQADFYKMNYLFSLEKQTTSLVSVDRDNDTTGKVVGACHDVLLYCKDNKEGKYFEFFMKNIQTKQQVQLPSPSFYYNLSVIFRFFCDPPGNPMTWRYSVVVVHTSEHKDTTKFPAHFLLSTNGNKWCDKVLSVPKRCSIVPFVRAPAIHGKHFLGVYSGAIFVEPFPEEINKVIECPLISWPPHYNHGSHCIGVSNGNLLFSFIHYSGKRLWVWILKDYETSEWHALHSIALQDLISIDPRYRAYSAIQTIGGILGFDPTNPDLFYTINARDIILWDLHHKTMQLIPPIRGRPGHDSIFGGLWTLPLTLPCSPTPLPNLL
ncbi:hypothetical protein RND81_12G003800 [Saponaria officinalis]|uniref:F-box domain-containing protein n=1 Tax=Saponaria officinalis TaxID=3572 RepID=A0AAW1H633_SAPOF